MFICLLFKYYMYMMYVGIPICILYIVENNPLYNMYII